MEAAPIRYHLTNFAYGGGVTATGSFVFDPTNNGVSNINVLLSGPNVGFNNFFAGGAVTFSVLNLNFRAPSFVPPPGQMYEGFLPTGSAPTAVGAAAQIQFLGVLLDGQNPVVMNTSPFGGFNFSSLTVFAGATNINETLVSGTLTPETGGNEVPEPGTGAQMGAALAACSAVLLFRKLKSMRETVRSGS